MSILSNRFPILTKPLAGWLVIVLALGTFINVWAFQEATDLPKLIVWFIGVGISTAIILFTKPFPTIKMPKWALVGLLSFVVLLIVGIFFTYDVRNSIFGLFPRYTGSLMFFIAWVLSMMVFSAVETTDFIKLFKYFSYFGVVVSAWGIAQAFDIGFYNGTQITIRNPAPSFLGNPNFSAMFVIATLPILLWITQRKAKWSMYLHWFYVGICLVALVIFNSRGAFLAAAIALPIYGSMALWKHRWKHVIVVGILAMLFAVTAGVFYYKTRIDVAASYSDQSTQTATTRLLLWDFTTDYIVKNPLFGTGLDNFFLAFRSNNSSVFTNQEWFDDAHNVILQFAASSGVVTTSIFLILVGYAIYLLYVRYKNSMEFDMAGPVIVAIIAWFVAGSFTPVAMPNWIFLALLLAVGWHFSGQELDISKYRITKPLLAALFVILTLLGVAMLTSELFLWQARKASEKFNFEKSNKLSNVSVKAFPLNTNARITYMQSLLELKRYDELDQSIKTFTDQHKKSSGIYQVASDYYAQMYYATRDGRYKQDCYRAIDTMISLNSNYAYPYRVATLLHIRMNDYAGALEYSNKTIVLSDNDFNSWIMNGKIHFELGNRESTEYALQEAFKIVQDRRLKYALQHLKQGGTLKDMVYPVEFN